MVNHQPIAEPENQRSKKIRKNDMQTRFFVFVDYVFLMIFFCFLGYILFNLYQLFREFIESHQFGNLDPDT
ncbi:hypothetical protein L2E82_10573 [Cichorium intybus]|uniref:Uncharacterized protein n=1 Tax=Cichorium intybus TaxID=13427 RepID=A0ACB9GAX9_CICIN|nr:hypothetical protein L2E82_10573 [Cichorium intybus]